ncbi:penicillin-binding transpeptidase domain-containing protein [Paenibacillus marinisediminis]
MEKRIKVRTITIMSLFLFLFIVLLSRLVWYQVINQPFWMNEALKTWSTKKDLPASRGKIYDRNGTLLAIEGAAYTVVVNPALIQQLKKSNDLVEKRINVEKDIVEGISTILQKPKDELYKIVSDKRSNGEYYTYREVRSEGYKTDFELGDELKLLVNRIKAKTELKDIGVYLIDDTKRYYPNGNLASHILGYIDRDGQAVTGAEAYFDTLLNGSDGWIQYDKDRKGTKLPNSTPIYEPPRDGQDVYLTIDANLQAIVEESMRQVYKEYTPDSMTVITMDPNSGDVLAMANLPDYDPNRYWEIDDIGALYNHAIKSVYEPGSTFKIITLAAAVQEQVFQPNDSFQSGKITVGGETIHDIKRDGWGPISYLDGLKRSSNVGFVKLGYELLGEERLENYIRSFGFGQATGIQLPGETVKQIQLRYPADYAAASYGHGQIWITPIQQTTGVAAVANGGQLFRANLLHKTVDPATGEESITPTESLRQVISKDTSRKVSEYLEQVVSDQEIGTGRYAYMEGYRVAGKTGTTIKAANGKYDEDINMYSFIGYAPVDDPKLITYVIIDNPKHYAGGSRLSSELFKAIMKKSLQYMRVPTHDVEPSSEKQTVQQRIPQLVGSSIQEVKTKLSETGTLYVVLGSGNKVLSQYPAYDEEKVYTGEPLYLFTDNPSETELPSMEGKSLRDVMLLCSLIDYSCKINGEGYVVSQEISASEQRTSTFTLQPRSAVLDP